VVPGPGLPPTGGADDEGTGDEGAADEGTAVVGAGVVGAAVVGAGATVVGAAVVGAAGPAVSIRAVPMCTFRSQAAVRWSFTIAIRTVCRPAPTAFPTGYPPYRVAETIVVAPTRAPSTVTSIVGQPSQSSPIAPTTTRPEPSSVIVAELLFAHSEACVPDGGTGVPVAGRIDPFTTVNGEAGAAPAVVSATTPPAAASTAATAARTSRELRNARPFVSPPQA
jgi:hypothetical protein